MGVVPQASWSESELDEGTELAGAGGADDGKCGVNKSETVGIAGKLWPLMLLLLGLGGIGVLEVVGTAGTTATTLVFPVTI